MNRVVEYGSEYDWNSNRPFLCQEGKGRQLLSGAGYYRSGRDALKAVAQACKGSFSKVLMPALSCSSMVTPFTMNGLQPVFYRLAEDYTAVTEDVHSQLEEGTILLYAPYFGVHPFSREELAYIRQNWPGTLFLEDRTQDILQQRQGGFPADVTIASIRKWVAVPDGGLLWSNRSFPVPAATEKRFAQLREEAMKTKSSYLETGETEKKDLFRQQLAQASELLDETPSAYAMTELSASLLSELDYPSIYARRQENVRALEEGLRPALEKGRLKLVTASAVHSTLYLPVLTDQQQALQNALARNGIYCPVIWPIPEEAAGVCPVAEYTARHMLALPCDHRYTREDMMRMAAQIVRICDEL